MFSTRPCDLTAFEQQYTVKTSSVPKVGNSYQYQWDQFDKKVMRLLNEYTVFAFWLQNTHKCTSCVFYILKEDQIECISQATEYLERVGCWSHSALSAQWKQDLCMTLCTAAWIEGRNAVSWISFTVMKKNVTLRLSSAILGEHSYSYL